MKRKLALVGLVLLMILMMPISIEAQDPSVQIYDTITDGQTFSGIENLFIGAYHPDGIAVISVATIEMGFICNALSGHLDYDWDTTEYEDGTYTLRITAWAVAWDDPQPKNWVEYTIHIDNIIDITDPVSESTTLPTTTSPTPSTTTYQFGVLNFWALIVPLVVFLLLVCGLVVWKRKVKEAEVELFPVGAKVFVICPYCGSKTEQGIMKCRNCGADL